MSLAGDHILAVRVYFEDTDCGGRVYHANYLKYAERGRTELLRHLDINHTETARSYGMSFAVRDCKIDFRRAAFLDDLLEVRSRLFALRGASLDMDQEIWRGDDLVTHIRTRIVCLGQGGRPARLPGPIRAALDSYVQTREQV